MPPRARLIDPLDPLVSAVWRKFPPLILTCINCKTAPLELKAVAVVFWRRLECMACFKDKLT